MKKVQMNFGNTDKYMEQGEIWTVIKVQTEIHELGDTPERKPACVDAKLQKHQYFLVPPLGASTDYTGRLLFCCK